MKTFLKFIAIIAFIIFYISWIMIIVIAFILQGLFVWLICKVQRCRNSK